MSITPFSAFTGNIGPLTRVTPFTHRDNATFLRILQEIIQYINTILITEANTELQRILDEYQGIIEGINEDFTETSASWLTQFNATMAALQAEIALLNNAAVAGMVTTPANPVRDAIQALIDDANEILSAYVDTEIESLRDYVDGQTADNGYLVGTFTGNGVAGERLSLFYSPDGKTVFGGDRSLAYTPVDGQGVRDPSLLFHNGKWFVTHTSNNGIDKDIQIAVSDTGAPGTWALLTVLYGGSIPSMWRMWAPEFVVDGSDVYIFFSSIVDSDPDVGSMYWIKATNTALTAWTAPVAMVFPTAPAHWIDGAFVKHTDNKWYMFYSTGNDVCRAVADTLTGTYVNDRTGNWAGWGTGIEGPEIVTDGGVYRAYFDRFVAGTGYWWSESSDLATWSAPVQLKAAPGVLKPGQSIRHGSFYKLPDKAAGNAVIAGQAMSPTVRHMEIVSDPGFTGLKAVATVATGWVTDANETTDAGIVSYDPVTGFITLNGLGVWDFALNSTVTDVTGVTRSFVEAVTVDGPETIHLRNGCGAEDVIGLAFPSFKNNAVGERIKFRVFADWAGVETPAQYPTRLRITLR